MKIIAGSLKGGKVIVPASKLVRPTTAFAKEAIFSTLYSRLLESDLSFSNMDILDLFAGSGALGFEAISRGSKFVNFVDSNFESVKAIRMTASNLKIRSKINIAKSDVEVWLKERKVLPAIVLLDPPYSYPHVKSVLEVICEKSSAQFVVAETSSLVSSLVDFKNYNIFKIGKYGGTTITFFEKNTSLPGLV